MAKTSTRFAAMLGVCLMTACLVVFAYVPVDYMYLVYGVGYGEYLSSYTIIVHVLCVCMYASMHVCMRVCAYICVCICIFMCM